ncbi:hypothetical protein E2562_002834 [Oryza meyeriana var. granulata]|uniref:RRM domain-containing protein n=1 Tax=Oryza meyeriana var. granulata TaxID=110450 RepID=A0A6G1BQ21_9ORYZ|nr:hypothetical protein E2562_002834 [Oryza meyeriana var. granulata]
MDAGGKLTAAVDAAFPQAEAIAAVLDFHAPSPTTEDDCDDLYGDVNLGFLPLSPPSPSPTSPPKTPSPGRSVLSPSPSPPRSPLPEPQPESEPPKPTPPRHQPPPPPLQHASGGGAASPPTTPLFIGELPYWTTDAEVEDALAPHGALHGLHFFADKLTGKSRGFCRADFLHPDAAASAAAALHGQAFDGRHCVASLCCPPALLRLASEDPHVHAPSGATRGRGRGWNRSNSTTARGNVGLPLGDPPALAPLARPTAPRLPQLPPFGGMIGGGGGYGGFAQMGQCNAGMGTGMMPSVMAPHVNPAFLAAGRMAMGGTGVWYDHRMTGHMWGGQQPWNFGGYEMPRRPSQQLNRNGDYGKLRGTGRRERPAGGRNVEGDIGNERGHPDRRQFGRDGVDLSRKHDHEERGRYRPRVLEEEREHERQWAERDRYGGDKRRCQEYPERDFERRGRAMSRSPSRDGDGGDHPRRWD